MPGESYRGRLGSLPLCLCDDLQVLITSLVHSGPHPVSDCIKNWVWDL